MKTTLENKILITKEWLKSKSACQDGYEWALKQNGINDGIEVIKFLGMLIDADHWDLANWVIVRVMTRPQYLKYSIFAAEQVLDIYEKKYPGKNKPRRAIKAAKKVLADDTPKNRAAVVAYAAYTIDAAAYAAYAAAYAAADTAADAAYAIDSAAYAAASAADAAYNTAPTTAYAIDARKQMRMKILNYGISLLEGSDGE